ncbi:MAG: 30S ribosomal protein S13 [Candidatus Diapherotrites archaeon]
MAEHRYFVRIANRDLNGNKPIFRALTGIKGIGTRMARAIAYQFEKEFGVAHTAPLGSITEEQDAKLEDIVMHPDQHRIPEWMLNRRRAINGNTAHLVTNELDFAIRNDLQTMKKLRSYKGIRHSLGLTVRGQRTKTSGRNKGAAVGVEKKKEEKPATAGKPAAPETGAKKK